MKKHLSLAMALLATLAAWLLPLDNAAAQGFPNRPVRIIVPLVPGGSSDAIARLLAQKLSEKWGQPVTVENKPGGSTIIAAQEIVRARPDGYSLFQPINSTLTINPLMSAKLPYEVHGDFTHITLLVDLPIGFYVASASDIRSVADLIALAKAKPASINFGSSDPSTRLATELFAKMVGVKLTHVPYKGGADVARALLTGEIQLAVIAVAPAVPFVKSGQFRPLAVGGKRRVSVLPDVPTMHEAGVINYDANIWLGLTGPAGIPKEIVAKIGADVTAVLQLPEVRERAAALGMEPIGSTPEAYIERIRSETARLHPLIKNLGMTLE